MSLVLSDLPKPLSKEEIPVELIGFGHFRGLGLPHRGILLEDPEHLLFASLDQKDLGLLLHVLLDYLLVSVVIQLLEGISHQASLLLLLNSCRDGPLSLHLFQLVHPKGEEVLLEPLCPLDTHYLALSTVHYLHQTVLLQASQDRP